MHWPSKVQQPRLQLLDVHFGPQPIVPQDSFAWQATHARPYEPQAFADWLLAVMQFAFASQQPVGHFDGVHLSSQTPFSQVWADVHGWHATPLRPQRSWVLATAQVPSAWQQPSAQVVGSHTQVEQADSVTVSESAATAETLRRA
jgi:hypothetical protein